MIWPEVFEKPALDCVGGGGMISGQPGAQRGEQCLGQDGEHDVQIDVEPRLLVKRVVDVQHERAGRAQHPARCTTRTFQSVSSENRPARKKRW